MTPDPLAAREARDVLLRVMQDEGIVGRKRQRIENAANGMVRASGVVMAEQLRAAITSAAHGDGCCLSLNDDRWAAILAAARENQPPTTDEIAAQEGLKPESLRQALRESHPDASPSEVIGRAHDIEENT